MTGQWQRQPRGAGGEKNAGRSDLSGVTLKPTVAEVVAAIESLYADRVKPFGRIILRRVGEKAAGKFGDVGLLIPGFAPRVDTKRLRKICETCKQLQVVREDAGEYSAFLLDRVPNFVDANDCFDPYPIEFWTEMENYIEGLSGDDAIMPGGRYACAQVLMTRNLEFLQDRCLGEVCHMIALAISRKILGYLDLHLVPYSQSHTVVKERCAVHQQPMHSAKCVAPLPLATYEQVRGCLQDLLQSSPGGVLPLPNVKRLFRSRYNVELSETTLGHSRLRDLLQDERFRDMCSVEWQGNGYVVVQRPELLANMCGEQCYPYAMWPGSPFLPWPSHGESRYFSTPGEPLNAVAPLLATSPHDSLSTPQQSPGFQQDMWNLVCTKQQSFGSSFFEKSVSCASGSTDDAGDANDDDLLDLELLGAPPGLAEEDGEESNNVHDGCDLLVDGPPGLPGPPGLEISLERLQHPTWTPEKCSTEESFFAEASPWLSDARNFA